MSLDTTYLLDLPEGSPPPGGFPLVLALHGLDQDGAAMRARLRWPHDAPYALFCPDGPHIAEQVHATGHGGGRSWYDYTGDQPAFVASLDAGIEYLERVLDRVGAEHPIDRRRVMIVGYSQGGYVAGFMAIKGCTVYRGLVSISSRVKVEALEPWLPALRGFPVLLIHGEKDALVAPEPQRRAQRVLEAHGARVVFHLHPGGHGFPRHLADVVDRFAREVLLGES